MNRTYGWPLKSGSAALLFSVALLAAFVRVLRKPAAHAEPVRACRQYEVAIDASASDSWQLGMGIYLTKRLCAIGDSHDLLSVYRVDDRSRQIYPATGGQGPLVNDTDQFQADLVAQLQALSVEKGTHSLAFWRKASASLKPGMAATFFYLTDGFEENKRPAEIAELHKLAGTLADNPHVRAVYLMGLNDHTLPFWKRMFRDLGARLHAYGSLTRASIDQIEEAVDTP